MRYYVLLVALVALWGCGGGAGTKGAAGNSKAGAASRIDVKHGSDPDAAKIDTAANDITVEELLAMKFPREAKDLENYKESRVGPFETSTYRITGTLKSIVHKKDGDYYLVVEGKTGAEAVVEVPDPNLCKGSPILAQITAARDELEAKYHPTDTVKEINKPATIEGVGFYGWKGRPGAGGHGSAPRLMPGTGFKGG